MHPCAFPCAFASGLRGVQIPCAFRVYLVRVYFSLACVFLGVCIRVHPCVFLGFVCISVCIFGFRVHFRVYFLVVCIFLPRVSFLPCVSFFRRVEKKFPFSKLS